MKQYLFGLFMIIIVFALNTANSHAQQDKLLVPAGRIIDQDVYDSDGKLIGEVEDIVIKRSGRVKKVIVEYGGFYDIADRMVGLSFKRMHFQSGKIVIAVSKDQLNQKPAFDFSRRGLITQYYYYSAPPEPYPSTSYYYDPTMRRERQLNLDRLALSPSRFMVSVITNRRMINEEGRDIGWIEDLLIDLEKYKVVKIVISVEHVLAGIGSKLALPYKPLGITGYGLVYDISLLNLKNMPKYINQDTENK